jgi:hypothetical protein
LLAGYAVLLSRWASRPLRSIGLPLTFDAVAPVCVFD